MMFSFLYRLFAALLAIVLAIGAGNASAYTIKGKIVNGTTGETNIDIEVELINPADGMKVEHAVRAVNGSFTVEDLDEAVAAYVVRVEYKNVSYDYLARMDGQDPVEVTVNVYDCTTSWEAVEVTIPHFSVTRHGDHLLLERVYEIANNHDPPATITGADGYFRFMFPVENVSFQGLFVSALGVPIERDPVKTGDPGVFLLDYPIRPGNTRVGVSYAVPYAEQHYTLTEKILYDIGKMTISTTDPDIRITSDTNELALVEAPRAAAAFTVEHLKKGSELHLHFHGGNDRSSPAPQQTAVHVVPNPTESFSYQVMAVMLAALLVLAGMAYREKSESGEHKLQLETVKEALLAKLLRLDDLYQTGAVAADAYYAKRSEIKNQLVSLMYRLGSGADNSGAGGKAD